ncbi:TolB family protein [Maricaulis sp.]|uniref:TolB family protein n=1 Tax=Maricaulis sp. TaxID=1486257 RepID=UPI003A91E7DA
MQRYLALAAAAGLMACSPPETQTPAGTEAANIPAAEPAVDTDDASAEETGLPGTDIRIFALDWVNGQPVIGAPMGGVVRPGYDNQPSFTPDGSGLLYTAGDDSGETDIWRLDLASGETRPVTRTPDESEYSPRVPPGEAELAYIYQPPGGYAGNAYLAHADNSGRHAAEELAPVGYYLFSGDMRHVVTFALGETSNTLQLIDRSAEPEMPQFVADNPGRSMARNLGGDGAWVTLARPDGGAAVHRLDFATGALRDGFDLPGQSQDFARITSPLTGMFAFDGFFSAAGGTLYYGTVSGDFAAASLSPAWTEIADLAALGLVDVNRIAVSPEADRIAFVVAD